MIMMTNMTSGSIRLCTPSHSIIDMVRLKTAAIIRIIVETSLSCERASFKRLFFFCFSNAFAPYFARRDLASSSERPRTLSDAYFFSASSGESM